MAERVTVTVQRPRLTVTIGGAGVGPDGAAIEALTGTGLLRRTGDDAWTLSTVTAAGLALLDDADAATQRATLGIEQYTLVLLSADVTESANVLTLVNDLQFVPAAGAVYHVEVYGVFTADASGTGLLWTIDDGNAAAGAMWIFARNTSDTTQMIRIGAMNGGEVVGASALAGGAEVPFYGWAIVTGDPTAPTAVCVKFRSEVAASVVTLKGGKCFLRYRRLA